MKAVASLISALWLSGCGGCQLGTPPARESAVTVVAPAVEPEVRAPAHFDSEPDCTVIVDAEPDFGAPPLTVHFETEVTCTASPVAYSWDFGDGSKGRNEPNPKHTYEREGEYMAVVRVSAPDGGASDDEVDISVDPSFDD